MVGKPWFFWPQGNHFRLLGQDSSTRRRHTLATVQSRPFLEVPKLSLMQPSARSQRLIGTNRGVHPPVLATFFSSQTLLDCTTGFFHVAEFTQHLPFEVNL